MKNLTDIINEMAKVDDVLKQIGYDLSRWYPGRYDMKDDNPNIDPSQRTVSFSFRGV